MMTATVSVKFYWLPQCLGGHSSGPFEGMRPRLKLIANTRDLSEDYAVDLRELVRCSAPDLWSARVLFPLVTEQAFLERMQQFELLDGTSVVAIGKAIR